MLGLALLAACGGEAPPVPADGAGGTLAGPEAEAARLGDEALVVLDEVVAYATSRRRTPRSLREAGVDSLTPRTARWLEPVPGGVRVWVAFRDEAGRTLVACGVDRGALEDAGLAAGTYPAHCRTADGATRVVDVARE